MSLLFFDLETTDLNRIGQILNYAFVLCDEQLNVHETFVGEIRISPTQLPTPEAILANKIDVLQHQLRTEDNTEAKELRKIYDFLIEWGQSDPLLMIGYNSINFDLPYLRTSFIRNGMNPFQFHQTKYGDLLHLVQYCYCTRPDFRKYTLDENGKVSLSLSRLAKNIFNITQTHNSLDDVLLTIKLAKFLQDTYDLRIKTFSSYQPQEWDKIAYRIQANYTDIESGVRITPYVLLDKEKHYSLWIDMDKFTDEIKKLQSAKELKEWAKSDDCKKVISWFNGWISPFFISRNEYDDLYIEKLELMPAALKLLGHLNLKNFFPPKNCDIEQHIYMMEFCEMRELVEAIETNSPIRLGKYGTELWNRYLINNSSFDDENILELFKQYVLYRYSGKMKIDKWDTSKIYQEGVYQEGFHRTYKQLIEDIKNEIAKRATDKTALSDLRLLVSLHKFYENSPIIKYCPELKT